METKLNTVQRKNGKYNRINYKNGEISMSSIWLNIVKINMEN